MGATISDAMLQVNPGTHDTLITLPNGNLVWIAPKSTTSFRVYESSDRVNWTLRISPTVTALPSGSVKYTTAIGHDGTYIVLVYVCNDGSVRSRVITISGWTATSEQIAYPATSGISIRILDVSVSPTGAVMLAIFYGGPSGDRQGYILRLRTAAGSWVAITKTNINTNSTGKANVVEIAVGWYKAVNSNIRRFGLFYAWGAPASDQGITYIHASVNETDGTGLSRQTVPGFSGFCNIGYPSDASFATVPRRIRAIGTNVTNVLAFGVNSQKYIGDGSYDFDYGVGVVSVSAFGANAAADTFNPLWLARMTPDGYPYPNTADGNFAITFAYDNEGNPSFNMVSSAVTFLNIRFTASGGSGSQFQYIKGTVSHVLAIKNYSNASSRSVEVRVGGAWEGTSPTYGIGGNTSLNWTNKRHDTVFQDRTTLYGVMASATPPVVTEVSPAANQTVASSTPLLGVTVVTRPGGSRGTPVAAFTPKYTIANDAAFTSGVVNFTGGKKTYGAYTDSSSRTKVTDQWTAAPIPSASKYLKALVVDAYGNESNSFATSSPFVITHPAKPVNIKPVYSETDPPAVPYYDPNNVGYSEHVVSWDFSDAWPDDYQTAYQINIIAWRGGDPPVIGIIGNTGKVPSANKSAVIQVPSEYRNWDIRFSVNLWDRYDQSVEVGGNGSLLAYDSSSVTSITPTQVDQIGNIITNAPAFDYVIEDGYFDTAYLDIVITQGNKTIAARQVQNPGLTGTVAFPSCLENNSSYTVTAAVTDIKGLRREKVYNYNTSWAPPVAPSDVSVSLAAYNIENQSYAEVRWTDATKDPDWVAWTIYRQVDQINAQGQVVLTGPLELIAVSTADGASMSYRDYFAPSGVRVGYIVRQMANRFGSVIESINTAQTSTYPVSDGYWLIDPTPEDPANASFRLYSVTADSYTRKYESQITHIIGRGNHEDRGDDLGREGSLTAQLRDSATGTARVKRMRIEKMKEEARSLFLRNPFGDIWAVSVGDIQVDRIAGVGLMEFVDLTIPYTEVYS